MIYERLLSDPAGGTNRLFDPTWLETYLGHTFHPQNKIESTNMPSMATNLNRNQDFQHQKTESQSESDASDEKSSHEDTDDKSQLSKQQLQQKNLVRPISKREYAALFKKGTGK